MLLAAHFFRSGMYLLSAICLIFPLLLLIKFKIAVRIIQLLLILGALEWFRTLYNLAAEKITAGLPWTRLALILGGVAIFTALSTLVFKFKSIKTRYKFTKEVKDYLK